MTIGKDIRVIQINRTNKTSIKEDVNILGGFITLNDTLNHRSDH
jgi:hypothetical protein